MERLTASMLKRTFENSYDFETKTVNIGGGGRLFATLCYIDGLVSGESIALEVIRPLTDKTRFGRVKSYAEAVKKIMEGGVYSHSAKLCKDIKTVEQDVLNGFCAVFLGGLCITFETRSAEKRSVDNPSEEKVVKGPKDAFTEQLKTNTMLVRRKLKSKRLIIEELNNETLTGNTVVVYMRGTADESYVKEVKTRLNGIKAGDMLTSETVEAGLRGNMKTFFPMSITTERPDKFCMNLLEGRVGVISDGLPMGYLTPATFGQFFKVPEDKAYHPLVASCLTGLRYIAMLITLLFPAFYVAVAMYHREMIPTRLMESIIASKESVPFPTSVEVIAMLLSFELLQEAGLRLPEPVGETVSIIGALIVGQSAVEAKVVSPVVIIVVAIAGIAGYTMPSLDMGSALRICRFLFVIAAITFGLPGVALAFCALLAHLCRLETCGVPYMAPFSDGMIENIIHDTSQVKESGIEKDPTVKYHEK